ncbi:hypothetical protein [Nocardia goodfellowii]|uniref:Uncharacterized protein n=1 Tax=Nocardia goodfellowii TaxID=882446 RepID=A0ABS4QJD3_9NOCA|nr:hypothetical protein [Nocardia goodfellowii]MBP2191821.1 hypothetical protein [Nocardia goodfellowii]
MKHTDIVAAAAFSVPLAAAAGSGTGLAVLAALAALGLAGLRNAACAYLAVVGTAATLAVSGGGSAVAAVAGAGATGYLTASRSEGAWSRAELPDLLAPASAACAFGALAVAVSAAPMHLPWAPLAAPVAALVMVALPLRAMRATPRRGDFRTTSAVSITLNPDPHRRATEESNGDRSHDR